MSRWSLVFVAFWALALTMRVPGPVSPDAARSLASAPHGSAGFDTTAPMDAVAVGRLLGEWNPSLSSVERDRIGTSVMRCHEQYALDPTLVTALIWVESRGRPWAVSPKGALGLMQVMPYMSEPLGLAGNSTTIESNIEAGCQILSDNIHRLGEADGVSAYFWGSNIRNAGYRTKVEQARERVRRDLRS